MNDSTDHWISYQDEDPEDHWLGVLYGMDNRTGDLYVSPQAALRAGVPEKHIVKLEGQPSAINSISYAVKRDRKRKNKAAKESRKKNR